MLRQSYPHQLEAANWLEDHLKALFADEMRLGKTRSTALCYLNHLPWLIICPASAKGVWRDEISDLSDARVDVVSGLSHVFDKRSDICIINFDVLGRYLQTRKFPLRFRGSALSVDECHRASNTDAVRTRAVQFFISEARRAVCLSGTPMPSYTAQLWPVLYSLGITGMDYQDFTRRYSAAWQAPWGWDARGSSNEEELRELISPFMLRRTKKQVFGDYIPYESKIITFDVEPDRREASFDLHTVARIANPLISIEGLSAVVKESGLRKVPDAIEFIEDRLREQEKIVVFFYHKEVGQALAKGLARYNPGFITGDTSGRQRDGIRARFRDSADCRVAGGNILAAGEAVDFSVADTSVFVECDWTPKSIDQAAQRTESMQKLGRCSTSYFLTLEKSIDHVMLRKVLTKQETINKIIVPSQQSVSDLLKY